MSAASPGSPTPPKVETLACSNCGAPLAVRTLGKAISIVCEHCHSILDARDPQLRILQRFEDITADEKPLIPLGTRGKWRGTVYEVVGFQVRSMESEGQLYYWREYLLFNPYKGFRYLTEYNGHWNDCSVVTALPEADGTAVRYLGKRYKHFQTCYARTAFVLGEFPWLVTVNDDVSVSDYIAPPYVLSSETTPGETTWTLGEYVSGDDIWKAFALPGSAPRPIGVYENQPSTVKTSASQVWVSFLGFVAALVVIFTLHEFFAQQDHVFEESYRFSASGGGETSFVTPEFELKGRTSDVEVKTDAGLSNQWIYLNYALIDSDTGQAYDFGREVSYYSGTDSDGHWTEGSQHDRAVLPSVPAGHYYLRIEPESDASLGTIFYTVTVTRDVPVMSFYGLAFAGLLLPALLISWRTYNFEQMRWSQSDHPMKRVGSDD